MTNNPTIDGVLVSRATIEAILKDGSCKPEVNEAYRAARKELSALIEWNGPFGAGGGRDAPAVERQEPVSDDEFLKMADKAFGQVIDYDFMGGPITDYQVLTIGAYGPAIRRLVAMARQYPASPPAPAPVARIAELESGRDELFQSRVQPWMIDCFGPVIAGDREERNHRFLEEALELVQACGASASEAHQLVDYVYGRPVGEPAQEVGGVMVTLAALCLANGLDMHADGETELARIWTKVEQIRAKQAAKPAMSPLPGVYSDRAPPAPVAVPDGWKLVPVEPDGNMRLASNRYKRDTKVTTGPGFYRAMLKAAPSCLDATAALNGPAK